MYGSRLEELAAKEGEYNGVKAAVDFASRLVGQKADNALELTYPERLRVHNLKYYTWIEQQGKTSEELSAQWYDADNYWGEVRNQAPRIDELIEEFNAATGLK